MSIKLLKKKTIFSYLRYAVPGTNKDITIEGIFTKLYPKIEKDILMEDLQMFGVKVLNSIFDEVDFSKDFLLSIDKFNDCLDKALLEKKGLNSELDSIVNNTKIIFDKAKILVIGSESKLIDFPQCIEAIDSSINKMNKMENKK